MSAETLRQAAEKLRQASSRASAGPWTSHGKMGNCRTITSPGSPVTVADGVLGRDAAHIVTMHPGVGLALADVLDESAAVWDDIDVGTLVRDDSQLDRLSTLARLILGGDA